MRFFSEIARVFQCENICISERLSTVEASFVISFKQLPNDEAFLNICSFVPARDNFSLTLKNDSNDIVRITNKQAEETDFSSLTDSLAEDDSIDVTIQIDKSGVEGRFSIYDFPSFSQDLTKRPPLEVLDWFTGCLRTQENLLFEVFDYDISFSTRTLAFQSGDNAAFIAKVDRRQRLSTCRESACFYNMNAFEVIPDDFIIEGVMKAGTCLKPLFGKLATILSLVYVSSSAAISGDIVNLQICGQRTTSHEIKLDDIQEDEKWISIYSWVFTDGNPTDKALIAHNVISLHCKYETLLNLNATVFDAIKTNYNLYLRNNVRQYLDMKRDIAKFIQNIVAQVGDYAVSILGKFKANLFAIFGFLFTVVLTKIGGTQKWDDIFSKHTVYLIELFVLGSLVYLIICFFETRYKLRKTKQGYIELKKNYEDVLSEAEIRDAFSNDKILNDTEKSSKRGMIVWSVVWATLLVLTVVVIEVLTTNQGLFVWLWGKVF